MFISKEAKAAGIVRSEVPLSFLEKAARGGVKEFLDSAVEENSQERR
jgi:hypothetical protein